MRSKSSGNLMAAVIAGGTSGAKPIVFSISSGNFAGFAVSRITAGKSLSGSVFQPVLKSAPRDRAVRFEQQLIFVPDVADRFARALVGNRTGKQIAAHRGEVGLLMNFAGFIHLPAVNRHEPREIARMADVHRVGNGIARRRNFLVIAAVQEISETRRCH